MDGLDMELEHSSDSDLYRRSRPAGSHGSSAAGFRGGGKNGGDLFSGEADEDAMVSASDEYANLFSCSQGGDQAGQVMRKLTRENTALRAEATSLTTQLRERDARISSLRREMQILEGDDCIDAVAPAVKDRNLYGSSDDMEFLPQQHGSGPTQRGSRRRSGNGPREMNLFGGSAGDSDDYEFGMDEVADGLGVSELAKQNEQLRKK
ncbi:unnamed protein product, partial [Symbiodinium microadriaticum]